MESLIEIFAIESVQLPLSLDVVVMFMGFTMILSTIELIACSLGRVRDMK